MSDTVEGEFVNTSDLSPKGLKDVQWKTRFGELIYLHHMTDSHIRNVALFLTGFGFNNCRTDAAMRILWLRVLKLEWDRRMAIRVNGNKQFKFNPSENRYLIND
jgi:hypothetical protein